MMASGMWGRLSNTAGALKNQVGRLAEDVLNSAEEFSQQVGLSPGYRCLWLRHLE